MRPLRRLGVASSLDSKVLSFRKALKGFGIRTVCDAARCPNRSDCFPRRAAAFMILGDTCTRNCSFCDVKKGIPAAPDLGEPERLGRAALALDLAKVVATSPTRDDLPDGGASAFALTICAIRAANSETKVEVLVPDFGGDAGSLEIVLDCRPDVFNHNVETVPRLYGSIRPDSDYERSLQVLARASGQGAIAKSAFMLGLGERTEEITGVLRDLKDAGCRMVVIGQYIPPSTSAWPLKRWVPEEEFEDLGKEAFRMGFEEILSAPLARSSYSVKEK